jgi:hypothetical protein
MTHFEERLTKIELQVSQLIEALGVKISDGIDEDALADAIIELRVNRNREPLGEYLRLGGKITMTDGVRKKLSEKIRRNRHEG